MNTVKRNTATKITMSYVKIIIKSKTDYSMHDYLYVSIIMLHNKSKIKPQKNYNDKSYTKSMVMIGALALQIIINSLRKSEEQFYSPYTKGMTNEPKRANGYLYSIVQTLISFI